MRVSQNVQGCGMHQPMIPFEDDRKCVRVPGLKFLHEGLVVELQ
jgi:hypothetical protein